MSSSHNLSEAIHLSHQNNINRILSQKEERLYPLKNKDCVYYRIQRQSLDLLVPFFDRRNTWLTIGDLQGLEANYLMSNNQDATASDISDAFLAESYKENLIAAYSQQNVERISFADDSFDYVVCREAYHHFPRAFLGLYEMIRVSRKAAILIEPIDILSKMPSILFLKNICDRISPTLINKIWKNRFSFENVGNYVFKISAREVEKMAMGMGLPCVAFKGLNLDTSQTNRELLFQTPANEQFWAKTQRKISFRNWLSRLHIMPYGHLCAVVFSQVPTVEMRQRLQNEGFTILDLPVNPYIKAN